MSSRFKRAKQNATPNHSSFSECRITGAVPPVFPTLFSSGLLLFCLCSAERGGVRGDADNRRFSWHCPFNTPGWSDRGPPSVKNKQKTQRRRLAFLQATATSARVSAPNCTYICIRRTHYCGDRPWTAQDVRRTPYDLYVIRTYKLAREQQSTKPRPSEVPGWEMMRRKAAHTTVIAYPMCLSWPCRSSRDGQGHVPLPRIGSPNGMQPLN